MTCNCEIEAENAKLSSGVENTIPYCIIMRALLRLFYKDILVHFVTFETLVA